MNDKLWKALGSIASTDETRSVLMRVHIREDRRTWEATDGHCALQVTFDADTDLAPGLYDWRASVARVKAGIAPEALKDDSQFPAVDKVMPEAKPGFDMRPDVAMNPQLVSRICDAASSILGAVAGNAGTGLIWQVGPEDLDAILAHVKAPGVALRAAVMPMRIDGPRRPPKPDTFDADSTAAELDRVKQERDKYGSEANRLASSLAVAIEARRAEQMRADSAASELDRMSDYRAHLEECLVSTRAELARVTDELTEARTAAETDEADSVRLRATIDELRAEVNGLRHLRPKVDPEPVLLTRPIVRA
jgi:hypothetical protein